MATSSHLRRRRPLSPHQGTSKTQQNAVKRSKKAAPRPTGAGGELLPREEARARDSSPQRSGSFPLILVLCWLLARPWPAMDFTPGAFKRVFPSVSFFLLGQPALPRRGEELRPARSQIQRPHAVRCPELGGGGALGTWAACLQKEAGMQMKPQLAPGTVLILSCGVRSWEQLLGSRSLCWGLDR